MVGKLPSTIVSQMLYRFQGVKTGSESALVSKQVVCSERMRARSIVESNIVIKHPAIFHPKAQLCRLPIESVDITTIET